MPVATSGTIDTSRELGRIKQELLDARERARRLCEGISAERWSMAPPAGGWSIGECLMHLNITSERYIPIVDEAIRDGRARGLVATGPPRRDFLGWLLGRILEPPYRIRTRTAASFVPQRIEAMAHVLEQFDYLQGELLVRLDRAAGLALEKLKIASPFNARMKYNLYSTFLLISVHQRHHLWQAEQVKRAIG